MRESPKDGKFRIKGGVLDLFSRPEPYLHICGTCLASGDDGSTRFPTDDEAREPFYRCQKFDISVLAKCYENTKRYKDRKFYGYDLDEEVGPFEILLDGKDRVLEKCPPRRRRRIH